MLFYPFCLRLESERNYTSATGLWVSQSRRSCSWPGKASHSISGWMRRESLGDYVGLETRSGGTARGHRPTHRVAAKQALLASGWRSPCSWRGNSPASQAKGGPIQPRRLCFGISPARHPKLISGAREDAASAGGVSTECVLRSLVVILIGVVIGIFVLWRRFSHALGHFGKLAPGDLLVDRFHVYLMPPVVTVVEPVAE